MVRMHRRVSATYGNRFFVLLHAEESHVAGNWRVYGEERVAWAEPLRLFKALQPAFGLSAARIGISEPRITNRKIRIQLEGFGKMHHGRLRPTAARVTEPQHQVPPMILLIESERASTTFERFVREFANRHARVQVEHA